MSRFRRRISCNNIFLDDGLNGKLGEFAGSSTDGQEPLVCYDTSHEHPEIAGISTGSELFALGSTFYEMMTGSTPYQELSDSEIIDAYREFCIKSIFLLTADGSSSSQSISRYRSQSLVIYLARDLWAELFEHGRNKHLWP